MSQTPKAAIGLTATGRKSSSDNSSQGGDPHHAPLFWLPNRRNAAKTNMPMDSTGYLPSETHYTRYCSITFDIRELLGTNIKGLQVNYSIAYNVYALKISFGQIV